MKICAGEVGGAKATPPELGAPTVSNRFQRFDPQDKQKNPRTFRYEGFFVWWS
ncbi:hypothetical protein MNKW57_16340 [Biformimicrobium ophioploci]|uniref:Uncharacterized protein n=1 Tax=Biformimicrobium ophioploci TaxID=3036711 RepID=A0ABQ6LYZ5_9GAMM|nr:hypothetical protein MNKW57_16340 [Microbulbifer sp. NKW57]